jgi:NAD(P)-dependent dehydrogenase (short-subunit alcohol dehydrogenase family)
MGRVDGKTAVVTGGALGIGRATSVLLAREGAMVAVTDVLEDEGRALAESIGRDGGTARFWRLDVSDEAQVRQVFTDVRQAFGHIDVLVNNAGISGTEKPTHEIEEGEWDRVMAINTKGTFLCTKHAIPYMREAGGGSIINLSSVYGIVGAPDAPPYHASKAAQRIMSKVDALLYAGDRIRVNSVHPGFILTPMIESYLKKAEKPAEARRALEALHPIGRLGEAEEVAWGIVYLASDESSFVTGSELVIDGGYTAR